ncbi:MAG TPA: DinB family protein [Candidatus Dormibacteraeota bacterium]|nr:DinB family protein [Candidatus Dormibacteraeota bacterium]
MNRAELMTEIDHRWHLIDDLVNQASAAQLLEAAPGSEAKASGWTVGEVLLHMAGWKRRALVTALRLARDPDAGDEEINRTQFSDWREYNDGLQERCTGVATDQILAEHRAAHAELIAAVTGLPDSCLLTDGDARFWLRPLLAHTYDHLNTDLRPVLG